jgi:cobalt-zinc-cadmium efflux system outer membrane protein
MKVKLTQSLLLLLTFCGAGANNGCAQSTGSAHVLTFEQALNRARVRAPVLLSASARIEEARGRLRGATIPFQTNPTVEGTVGPRISVPNRFTQADVSISQDFESFGRRDARIAGAEAGVSRELAVSQETARQLLRDVAGAFMRALAGSEKLKVLTDADRVASDFLAAAERRYELGDVPILDVNLGKNRVARTQAELRSARGDMAGVQGELHLLLGISADQQFVPAGGLKDLRPSDLNALIKTAEERPDIKVLESELRQAESEVRLGNTFKSPDFGVIGRYQRDQGDNIAEGGIRLSIPVFSRGQEQRATGTARAARLRGELDALKMAIVNEIRSAFDAYTYQSSAVQEFETRALPSLEENETLARRSYEEGEIGLAELLLIRREMLETKLAYVNTLLNSALAAVDLQFKAGLLR